MLDVEWEAMTSATLFSPSPSPACTTDSFCKRGHDYVRFWTTDDCIILRFENAGGCVVDPSEHSSFAEVERHLERNLAEKTSGPLDR